MGVRTPDPPRLPKHVPAKNAPDFTLPNKDTPKTRRVLYPNLWRGTFRGVCFCAPTRVHQKPGGFYTQIIVAGHFGAYAFAPYTGTCKIWRVLDPNLWRGYLKGVCNTPLHGYTQKIVRFHISPSGYTKNPPGFRRKPLSQDISGRMQYAPTRVRAKPARFHISAPEYAKNAPDFTLPNRDTPKTYPVLGPNLRRKTFGGVCFCAPTRVRAKPARFHISAPEYVKNAPDFTHPNKDTPKTRSVLGLNRRRETFRGVCNTPLHGYVKNPPGSTFPHPNAPKTYPISPFQIRIYPNPARF